MKQVLVEIDDRLADELERVAPSRSRKRSEFIRSAIRQALWDLQEKATAEAYARQPDSDEPAHFDPAVWDPAPWPQPERRRTTRRKKA